MASRTLVSLGDDRIARLDEIAAHHARSRSALIRDAVDCLLDEDREQIERHKRLEVLEAGFGAWKNRTDIGDAVEWQELDIPIAARATERRNERRSLKFADAVILASAQVHGHVLVTRNTKDFPADLPGIRIPYTL